MHDLFAHGSLPLLTALLLLGGVGLPIPEDPALIGAGALAAKGLVPLWLAITCCVVGVIGGDLMLFFGARHMGPAIKRSRPFRALGPERLAKLDDTLMRRGGMMVFIARHMMGVRAVTFALAGMHHMKVRTFLVADCLAFMITGPLWFGLGYAFATRLDEIAGVARIEHLIVYGAIAITVGYFVYAVIRSRRRAARAATEKPVTAPQPVAAPPPAE